MSNQQVGVWLDHRKAITVVLGNSGIDLAIIESDSERPSKSSGGHRQKTLYAHQDIVAEDHRKRRFESQAPDFFEKILRRIKPTSELVLMGPGEAKKQFVNYLMRHGSPIRLKELKPTGEMTTGEVARHVCEVFHRAYY